jgi:hypothetical protein
LGSGQMFATWPVIGLIRLAGMTFPGKACPVSGS